MLNRRFISMLLASIFFLSSLFGSIAASAQGGDTTVYLPMISKPGTLTVGYPSEVGILSPFFYKNSYDLDIVNLTQINLLTTDRQGMVVENAVAGETRSFNGTPYTYTGASDVGIDLLSTGNTRYTFTLRSDLMFADGTPVNADDLIFTLYTFLDPTYDGSTALNSYPIVGLLDYQTQTTPEIYTKYETLFTSIYDAGKTHVWTPSDPWTQAQQADVWNRLDQDVVEEVGKIVDYVVYNYTDFYAWDYLGFTPQQVYANEGLQIAFGMTMWGFADTNTTSKRLTASCSGKKWNLNYEYPTRADYAAEIMLCYNDDYRAAFPYESVDGTDVYEKVKTDFIRYWGPLDPDMIGGIPNISGIQKLNQSTVIIEFEGFDTAGVYAFLEFPVTPLHYYGNAAKYNYSLNMFGFDFGDLSLQRSKDRAPMGAGPYQFDSQQSGVTILGVNRYYYKGAPNVDQIKFVTVSDDQLPSAINSDQIDLAEISYNRTLIENIYSINSNGELTGDVITTSKVDNLGYGYLGINAWTVKVGSAPSSDASRNLRKALSTILAVFRKPVTEAYYGLDGASILEYPIIRTSWGSPQPDDAGYREAFSVDVNGNPIYTSGMSQAQRVASAQQAALGFFQAAGFTVSNGMVVAAPAGAKLTYEIIIPGGGIGDHPAFGITAAARNILSEIGITLTINDCPNTDVFWDAIVSGTQELWAAAWSNFIDPDLFQVYHSSNIGGLPGSSESNHYHIQDPQLDQLIMEARSTDDQLLRQALYRQAFDIIMDWGVEVPNYNRKNFAVFSTQRIDTSTITPDITTFWSWQNDIENMRVK